MPIVPLVPKGAPEVAAAGHESVLASTDTVSIGTFFADALNRERSLTAVETALLVKLLSRARTPSVRRAWSRSDDRLLAELQHQLCAAEIAARMGRTAWSVRSRIRTLKRKAATVSVNSNAQDQE